MKYVPLPGISNFLKGTIYLNLESIMLKQITPAKQPWNLLAEVICLLKNFLKGIWIDDFHIVWPRA